MSWAKARAERKTINRARFYEPKTQTERREIEIDDELVRELGRWKLACRRGDLSLVFPNAAGDPLHRRTIHKQGLTPALAATNVGRHFTVRALRRRHASALLLAGVPIPEVSSRLGHKNAFITMKVYTHFLRGSETKAAATILALISGATEIGKAA